MTTELLTRQILKGDYDSSELNTLLATDDGNYDFRDILNTPKLSTMLFDDSTSLNLLFASSSAKTMILNSTKALAFIADNEIATKTIFANSTMASDFLTNANALNAYFSNFNSMKRLQRQVNTAGSKLKQAVFYTSATLSVTNMKAYSTIMIGGGSFVFTSGTGYSGAGAELLVKSELLNLTAALTMTVGSAGHGGSLSGTDSTITGSGFTTLTANGGDAVGGGGGGTTTNNGIINLRDKNLMLPWQSVSFTQKGGNPLIESGSDIRAGGLGGEFYKSFGKGADLNNEIASPATAGIIIFNYVAD